MTVDDIFDAAVANDTDQLKQLLDNEGEELLSELITTDEDESGCISQFTVLFSILAETASNINYEILDILIEHGASFNKGVTLKQNGCTTYRPLLEFAVSVWENPVLTEYMLNNGALPNAAHTETDHYGRTSKTIILWYALNADKSAQLLELLLKYGANPEKCCEIYIDDLGVWQYLPPLYYSMVENSDFGQTVCLLRYGASPQCGIDLGVGFQHNTNFKKYLAINHPNLSSTLVQAFEMAQKMGTPERCTPLNPSAAPVIHDTQPHHLNAGSRVTSMKRCYGKFTAYLFGNFSILGLAFCLIGPLVWYQQDPEVVPGLLCIGVPCALIASMIYSSVKRKARKRGQDGVMLQFIGDSILMFAKALLLMTIILIPLAKAIGSNIQWEERKTASGGTVMVKKTGDGTYMDAHGRQYSEQND